MRNDRLSMEALYLKKKGFLFWMLHVLWSYLPVSLACFLASNDYMAVIILGTVLFIGGYLYHRRSSHICGKTGVEILGDPRVLLAEQKTIEMMSFLLSKDAQETARDIASTRAELRNRFARAAPIIREKWMWHSFLPHLISFVGLAVVYTLVERESWIVSISSIVSFVLMTTTFVFRSPVLLADIIVPAFDERQKGRK